MCHFLFSGETIQYGGDKTQLDAALSTSYAIYAESTISTRFAAVLAETFRYSIQTCCSAIATVLLHMTT